MDNNYQAYFDRLRSEIKKNKKLTKVSRQELFSTDLYNYVDANMVQETEVSLFFMHQIQDTENVSLPDIPPQEPMDRDKENKQKEDRKKTGLDYKI